MYILINTISRLRRAHAAGRVSDSQVDVSVPIFGGMPTLVRQTHRHGIQGLMEDPGLASVLSKLVGPDTAAV